jgi:phosphoglycerol transferase MdoB-like AlkP superfamily enzyme
MTQLFRVLLPYIYVFITLECLVRIAIAILEYSNFSHGILSIVQDMLLGLVSDVMTLAYIVPIIIAILLITPQAKIASTKAIYWLCGVFALFCVVLSSTAIGQLLFWDEIGSRFNFIAVDYLIYADEVMQNIEQSYPLGVLCCMVGLASFAMTYFYRARLLNAYVPVKRGYYFQALTAACLFALTSFYIMSDTTLELSDNRYDNQLAKNGIFSLFSAFRNNELPYKDFYLSLDDDEALTLLRTHLSQDGYAFKDANLTRHIHSTIPETRNNIILITVESLGADYMAAFGNKENLTPNLDALAKESLFFSNVYATGTRTVYGLHSISLSIPPIPGNAIVRRPENGGLFTMATVLNSKGYDSKFLYGGYGYFDNMNQFFSGNGYTIVDRASLNSEEVRFSNAWGVSDEDIFAQAIKESDASYNNHTPFFTMIMTTSNHQPFTFPDGRIDIPSGTGRKGGVKYSDYAIGDFIKQAKSKPWFANTIFVVVADHTAGSSGKMALTPEKHRIPMMFYAPELIQPQKIVTFASQIDLAPTLFSVMNLEYNSKFYGRNLFGKGEERAFIANYQNVGLLKPDSLTILHPDTSSDYYVLKDNEYVRQKNTAPQLLDEAIAYFQNASRWRELSKSGS